MKSRGDSFVSPPFTRCFCICIVLKGGVRKGGTVSPHKKPAALSDALSLTLDPLRSGSDPNLR